MAFLNLKTYFKFLSRNKLYTIVNILGFAISLMFVFLLGTYIIQEFSVDNFQEKKDRIYILSTSQNQASWSNPVAEHIKNMCPEVENYTRIAQRNFNFKYENLNSFYKVNFVDSSFFNIFSFKLLEGDPSQVLAVRQSAVLTESFANKIFSGKNPIGRAFSVDGVEVTVTGIMEDFPDNTIIPASDIVCNYNMISNYWDEDVLEKWNNSSFTIFFLERKNTDLRSKEKIILEDFKKDYWLYSLNYREDVLFIPLEQAYFKPLSTGNIALKSNNKSLMYTYLSITILILIVAILNYINLSVSQVSSRGKEAAMKKLLGSPKKRILIQFISETVLMTLLAAMLGILFSFFAQPFFNNVLNTNLNLIRHINFFNITFILISIVVIGIISGLFPALVVSKFKPIEIIKGSFSLKVKTVYSKILITFQYTVAITLFICSIFLVRQTNYIKNYDLGFDTDRIFIIDNILDSVKLKSLKNELLKIPGVGNVSYSTGTPLDGGYNNSLEYNGEPVSFQFFEVDSSFFDVYGIRLYPFEANAIENSIWLNPKGYNILKPDSISRKVTGFWKNFVIISGTTNEFNFSSLHKPVEPALIICNNHNLFPRSISVKILAEANAFETADLIKEIYSGHSEGEIFGAGFADDIIQENYDNEDKTSKIIVAFSTLTMAILMMGILAMSLYYVRQKEKEIAIRKMNGAKEKNIMFIFNMNFIRWIIIAFTITIPLSYFIMQKWLQNFSYKIPLSWWVFAIAGIAIVILSVIFVTLQSWKTATANPALSLKNE